MLLSVFRRAKAVTYVRVSAAPNEGATRVLWRVPRLKYTPARQGLSSTSRIGLTMLYYPRNHHARDRIMLDGRVERRE